jgi:hypothetical protein
VAGAGHGAAALAARRSGRLEGSGHLPPPGELRRGAPGAGPLGNARRDLEACAEATGRYGGQPIAEAEIPAVRYHNDAYRSATVVVGFYRMK